MSLFDSLDAERVAPLVRELGGAGPIRDYDSAENRVYGFATADGDRVVKLYRPARWPEAAVRDEIAFVRELADAGVPTPVHRAVGEWGGMIYATFDAVPAPCWLRSPRRRRS